MATKPPATTTDAPAQPVPDTASIAPPQSSQPPADPQAGGRYLRDPATGALTPNPETFSQPE